MLKNNLGWILQSVRFFFPKKDRDGRKLFLKIFLLPYIGVGRGKWGQRKIKRDGGA